jgi:arylmalonate decarboxylase
MGSLPPIDRRALIRGTAALCAASLLPARGDAAADARPMLGLILPPDKREIPEEGPAMYGAQLRFVANGLGIERMTPDSFDAALERLPAAARELAAAGAKAIVLAGTSLTFYKGEAYNRQIRETITRASGLPATTMSNGVIDGLKAVGARRIAVATAYNDVVNARLRVFLEERGFEPLVITGLGIEAMTDLDRVTQAQLADFGARVHATAPAADALFLSCGGFRTLEIIAPLEARTGVPVVSSLPHALWAGARLVGLDGVAPGYGRLLSGPNASSTLPGAPPRRG